jgi:hypothetical protein
MSFNNNYVSQSAASSSDNFKNAPEPSMAQYTSYASVPQVRSLKDVVDDLDAHFRSSDSDSDPEWLLQQPARWAAPRSNSPEPTPHDAHLSEHDEVFYMTTTDVIERTRSQRHQAVNSSTPTEGHTNHQYMTESQIPPTYATQMAGQVRSNTALGVDHQAHSHAVQTTEVGNGHNQFDPYSQPSLERGGSVQPNGPSYVTSHGSSETTGTQPGQHFGAQNAVQNYPAMHNNLQVIASTPPAEAHINGIGQFLKFQLPNHIAAAPHVNMNQTRSMSSFKIEKIDRDQPQTRIYPPQPAQHMVPPHSVYQVAPMPSEYQHTTSVQPAQPMTSSQRGEDGTPSQHAQHMFPLQDARDMAPSQLVQHVDVSRVSLPSSQTAVAPNMVSVKRKARSDPEDDMPVAKKTMTSTPQAGLLPPEQSRPKMAAKKAVKEKYTAIAHVMNDVLPNYSQVALSFSSRDAAAAAAAQKLANKLANEFRRAHEDASIPQTVDERLEIVRTLFGAMKDVSRAKDIESEGVTSRWGPKASKRYDDVDIEATCWEIVTLTERLHREGPSVLSIRDPNYVVHIKNCAKLTFDQRMRVITTLAYQWKARCDGLIKGDTIQTVVAAPLEALQSAVNNWAANAKRAKLYKFAKAHEDGPKETAAKSRKGKKTGPTDSTPQAEEADFPQQAKFDSSGDAGYSIINESL